VKKANLPTILVAILVALILLLRLVSFQVRETQVAVKTTFGELPEDTSSLAPGLHWKWPWPIQEVYRYDRRLRVYEDILDELQTRDGKPILVHCYVGWRIMDAATFLKNVGNEERAKEKIGKILRDQKGAVIGGHPFSDLVSLKDKEKGQEPKFEEIEGKIRRNVSAKLSDLYGIDVPIVGIKRLELPQKITIDVFKRMENERMRLAEKYRSEGERLATEIRADADRQREETLAEGLAKAKRTMGEADADAAQYYEVFAENPELAIFLRKLDALEGTLERRATVVLDGRSAPFDILEDPEIALDRIEEEAP